MYSCTWSRWTLCSIHSIIIYDIPIGILRCIRINCRQMFFFSERISIVLQTVCNEASLPFIFILLWFMYSGGVPITQVHSVQTNHTAKIYILHSGHSGQNGDKKKITVAKINLMHSWHDDDDVGVCTYVFFFVLRTTQ